MPGREENMTYQATIETVGGPVAVSYTDEQIDAMPETSIARQLRDDYSDGAVIAPSEIAAAAWRYPGVTD